MQKYRLKKDLPLAKAGTVVKILPMFNNKEYYGIRKYNEEYGYFSLGYIKDDILNEWLEEIPEKPNSVWDLNDGDEYFGIKDIYGYHIGHFLFNKKTSEESMLYGNVFLTREDAQKELEKRKAIQKIKKYCFKENICIKYIQDSNDIVFRINDQNDIVYNYGYRNGNLLGYFSHENAQKILEKFEEELKLILS